jgi:hypothetical protein
MTQARREFLPGWRSGLLVLGLYAMLLQAFFAGLAGPLHAAPGFDAGVTCSEAAEGASSAQGPAGQHQAHDCVCPALCHAGGLLTGADVHRMAFDVHSLAVGVTAIWAHIASSSQRLAPPARAPPHAGFVVQS